MARQRNPNRDKAFEIYKQHNGEISLVEIASQLNLSDGTIRGWKSKDKWEQKLNGTLQKNMERSKQKKRARGGQPGNKNAEGHGAPAGNKNNEKHGFFAKWLPEETFEIFKDVQDKDPLDLLWDNIQLQYAAIMRAQKLMYVKDQNDLTTTKIAQGYSESGRSEKWEVQQAWDKHATFLQAQSRAMKTLESMLKQYDSMINNDSSKASEEQRLRIAKLKYEVSQLSGGNDGDTGIKDFLKAIKPTEEDIKELFADEEVVEDEKTSEE